MKPSLISFGVSGTNPAVSAFVSVQADALPLQESLFVSSSPDDVEHSISEQSVFWCISNKASLFSAHLNSAKTFVIHPDHLMSPFSQQLLLLSYFQRGCHSGYYCIFDLA